MSRIASTLTFNILTFNYPPIHETESQVSAHYVQIKIDTCTIRSVHWVWRSCYGMQKLVQHGVGAGSLTALNGFSKFALAPFRVNFTQIRVNLKICIAFLIPPEVLYIEQTSPSPV